MSHTTVIQVCLAPWRIALRALACSILSLIRTISADDLWLSTCFGSPASPVVDRDHDGISDDCEQTAAERFAPVVYHASNEFNWPVNVEWFLHRPHLRLIDRCWRTDHAPTINLSVTKPFDLLNRSNRSTGQPTITISNETSRDPNKQITYYLSTVDDRAGSRSSQDWTTYFHTYRNRFDKREKSGRDELARVGRTPQ